MPVLKLHETERERDKATHFPRVKRRPPRVRERGGPRDRDGRINLVDVGENYLLRCDFVRGT